MLFNTDSTEDRRAGPIVALILILGIVAAAVVLFSQGWDSNRIFLTNPVCENAGQLAREIVGITFGITSAVVFAFGIRSVPETAKLLGITFAIAFMICCFNFAPNNLPDDYDYNFWEDLNLLRTMTLFAPTALGVITGVCVRLTKFRHQ